MMLNIYDAPEMKHEQWWKWQTAQGDCNLWRCGMLVIAGQKHVARYTCQSCLGNMLFTSTFLLILPMALRGILSVIFNSFGIW